jgi:hypothetical protein
MSIQPTPRHQRCLVNRTSRVLPGITKFHFRSHWLMDRVRIASLHHQPVQANNPFLVNHRKGQQFLPSKPHAYRKPETEYCRVPAQHSFNPQILRDDSFAGAYIWPQNDGDNFSHSFVGPTVTPHRSRTPGSSSKRKREPDVPAQVLLPHSHNDWQVVPQSSGAPYDRKNLVLCSRCNIYESLVS